MKCGVMVCPNEGTIKYSGSTICEICYVTMKWIVKNNYELGGL